MPNPIARRTSRLVGNRQPRKLGTLTTKRQQQRNRRELDSSILPVLHKHLEQRAPLLDGSQTWRNLSHRLFAHPIVDRAAIVWIDEVQVPEFATGRYQEPRGRSASAQFEQGCSGRLAAPRAARTAGSSRGIHCLPDGAPPGQRRAWRLHSQRSAQPSSSAVSPRAAISPRPGGCASDTTRAPQASNSRACPSAMNRRASDRTYIRHCGLAAHGLQRRLA
jgi:hypothetical protein